MELVAITIFVLFILVAFFWIVRMNKLRKKSGLGNMHDKYQVYRDMKKKNRKLITWWFNKSDTK